MKDTKHARLMLTMAAADLQAIHNVEPFIDFVDLTDYAVQFRYETPSDLDQLDRLTTNERIRVFYPHIESLFD